MALIEHSHYKKLTCGLRLKDQSFTFGILVHLLFSFFLSLRVLGDICLFRV